MRGSTGFVASVTALYAVLAQAQYTLDIAYDASNFFSGWDFFTGQDPTNGFVEYVDINTANAAGLVGTSRGAIFMGVDSKTVNPADGRKSVRLTSQKSFTRGLYIADIAHMPASVCGSWPAFWSVGGDWPQNGEIDIIEGVNAQKSTQITLHTQAGFSLLNAVGEAATHLLGDDCHGPDGCGQSTSDSRNYGNGFNAIGGGVYATQWTDDHISVWFFPRGSIPADVDSASPNPANWGTPLVRFNGQTGPYFKEHNLVFDTTFCGDWAGKVWASDPVCSALAPTCQEYVARNPAVFAESYWAVNSVKVFQSAGDAGTETRRNVIARPFVA